ncbi:fused response regulator/phosphatase [Streptomyces cocklensis]|uniref:Response regulator receiver domain-containing protein n=1 Tax=Actinacidiphila cocklensis TaxID=887465 RepID=A0A9W4DZ96_9ACTN|nr:fused response regulator/phosphatase [Actinacidiphila cocklensis]MDD1058768.1 fused response regulator/phosphatase [Actinacidiphila cocklensis]CAG6398886.1 Response regulator receiver domain-containing protein [Actinacidiphila cocklensis]
MSVDLPGAAGATVLLVDDNPTNRYVLGTYLRRAGHEVLEAEDGVSALELLRQCTDLPELAVIDIRLPDMTGFEVCEIIKADARTAPLPIIHVSASAISVTDRAQGLNMGADAYLTEPVASNELLATVAAVLRYARARQRAETLATRLRGLNRATLDFYSAENVADLAARAAAGARRLFGVDALVVVRTAEDGLVQMIGTQGGTAAAVAEPPERFARAVLRLQSRDDAGVRMEVVPAGGLAGRDPLTGGTRALAIASARVKGTGSAAGVVLPQDALGDDDYEVLTQLAHACALSLEALRSYREEHTLALTLQRTFLPASLPATSLADLAVRYLPASQTAEIGGDFYEALPVPDGLLLAVGDVAGHSLDAAIVMGEIRHALRAYALEGHGPAVILSHLERLLRQVDSPVGATLCVALVEESGGAVQVANAGHLPLAVRNRGEKTYFVTEHGPMLGLDLTHPPAVRVLVGPGTQLVMVTDGLLERRDGDLDEAMQRMADVLTGAAEDPEEVCELLLAHFPPDGRDDVALMTARLR